MLLLLLLAVNSRLIITEVMSNVKGSDTGGGNPGDRNEFVEIYNQSADTIDLASYFIYDFDSNDAIWPWANETILVKYPNLRINSTIIYPYTYALILDQEYTSSDTVGGYVQPYSIPDSTLVLTTDDTSIGGGLENNDPLIIFSAADACTTSFGTPYDTLDHFPGDPGDGISWERIDLALPDTISNWYPAIDSAGCTPGRENSVTTAFDLAIDGPSIIFTPATLQSGEDLAIEIRVKNLGLRPTADYALIIFDDQNHDSIVSEDESLTQLSGAMVNALDSVSLFYTYARPTQGLHSLGFNLEFVYDLNLANNLVLKNLQVFGEIGELALSPPIFTPNGDGIDDQLQIDYRLPEPGGKLTIAIFDTRGKLIHNLLKNETCSTDQGTIFWDGNSAKGSVPTSMYIVYLEYKYQTKITKAKKTTVLAR